jgi:hypothetical protein
MMSKSNKADSLFKLWPVQPAPKPSFLQKLSQEVNYCTGYSIQRCVIPPDLQLSQETYFLHQEILTMQRKLKASIRRDYEVQRGKILLERKRVIDKSG